MSVFPENFPGTAIDQTGSFSTSAISTNAGYRSSRNYVKLRDDYHYFSKKTSKNPLIKMNNFINYKAQVAHYLYWIIRIHRSGSKGKGDRGV